MNLLCLLSWALLLAATGDAAEEEAAESRPNVLFVVVDDMNDWIGPLGGYPGVKTPNLDRLAARGTTFTNAHCAAPACQPSRIAVLTGKNPHSSGVYSNKSVWRDALPDAVTLPRFFRNAGYQTVGLGKIFHGQNKDPDSWDRYEGKIQAFRRKLKEDYRAGKVQWSVLDLPDDVTYDSRIVSMAAEFLAEEQERPFFLACGLHKPHMPWSVPRAYYELYSADEIRLPATRANDLDDVPAVARAMIEGTAEDHRSIEEQDLWRDAVHAYLASVSFVDAQIGRLLDALDASPHGDGTIIVLWSDHGFHLGQKRHWRKFTLWEESTRVPLFVAAPGVTEPGSACALPVGLVHLFPTLADLCGLSLEPIADQIEGSSLRPLLEEPAAAWESPALTTASPGNHSLRSERWRYTRYADGSEELYDHSVDPEEWDNLAGDPARRELMDELAARLPRDEAPAARER